MWMTHIQFSNNGLSERERRRWGIGDRDSQKVQSNDRPFLLNVIVAHCLVATGSSLGIIPHRHAWVGVLLSG